MLLGRDNTNSPRIGSSLGDWQNNRDLLSNYAVNFWEVVYYRPIFLISFLKEVFSEKCYSFSVGFLFHKEGSPLPAKIF